MMGRHKPSTEILVIEAYRQSRGAGLDEWTACEAALAEFKVRHPEASVEFANTFISHALATLGPRTSDWPTQSRRSVPADRPSVGLQQRSVEGTVSRSPRLPKIVRQPLG
jgi:hypothetical protein